MNKTMQIPFVQHFKGKEKGPCVSIIGSLHGDEKIGSLVLKELEHTLNTTCIFGEIYLILGNPQAYKNDTRFVDEDLNRLFGHHFSNLEKIPEKQRSIEQQRALELSPILKQSDFLLDIHSTTKPSVPFVYCEDTKQHMKLANLLETEYIVSAASDFRPNSLTSSTDNFVDRHGGIGLTYETGWHRDLFRVDTVVEKTKLFLQAFGSCQFDMSYTETVSPKHLIVYEAIIPTTESFMFHGDYSNFHFFHEGGLIAREDKTDIIAQQDSFLIFPKKKIIVRKTAGYLARIVQ